MEVRQFRRFKNQTNSKVDICKCITGFCNNNKCVLQTECYRNMPRIIQKETQRDDQKWMKSEYVDMRRVHLCGNARVLTKARKHEKK